MNLCKCELLNKVFKKNIKKKKKEVWFLRRAENQRTQKETLSRAGIRTNNKLNPLVGSTQATLVGDECRDHGAIPALNEAYLN